MVETLLEVAVVCIRIRIQIRNPRLVVSIGLQKRWMKAAVKSMAGWIVLIYQILHGMILEFLLISLSEASRYGIS